MTQRSINEEIKEQKKRAILLILTGPTASGKDTMIKLLKKMNRRIDLLVTTTSRPKRLGEVEGREYYFVSREKFEKMIAEGAFLEWVDYLGHYKGGQKRHIEEALRSGKDLIWRPEVRGAKNIKPIIKDLIKDNQSVIKQVAFVFLTAPNLEILKKRMKRRATETGRQQKAGLDLAKWEMDQYDDFDYLVINEEDKQEEAARKILAIIEAERMRIR